ncbi:hypothetical protein BS50DRAFT_650309 [Corynespora cassiicola Philippines]|uniref:RING-type domain-containing protein n=1 Tax=Corynespora cassiicola Philippines TaxID=1448308 RepID=A0A2T2N8X7_CORCC|nr:hypothetical protein BS50DRAFT_650309 [Corynespora cassiicola Philippines]
MCSSANKQDNGPNTPNDDKQPEQKNADNAETPEHLGSNLRQDCFSNALDTSNNDKQPFKKKFHDPETPENMAPDFHPDRFSNNDIDVFSAPTEARRVCPMCMRRRDEMCVILNCGNWVCVDCCIDWANKGLTHCVVCGKNMFQEEK